MENLVIKNGKVETSVERYAKGGGISATYANSLTLINVRLTNNSVTCKNVSGSICESSEGGAIYSANADLRLENVEIDHNSAVYAPAIYFWVGSGDDYNIAFTISNSAIHDNKTLVDKDRFSAAIGGHGRLFLTNSTMAKNDGFSTNGKVNIHIIGQLWVQNATLISEDLNFNVIAWEGVWVRNSILLKTSAYPYHFYKNCSVSGNPVPIVSQGVNLASDDSCFPIPAAGDQVMTATEVRITSLDDYGGTTPTIALLEGSPAVDRVPGECKATRRTAAGLEEYTLATDQRGFPRDDGNCEAGAYEGQIFLRLRLYLPLITK